MKLGEVIERIESYYSKGVPANDSRLSPLFIYDAFKSVRKQQLVRKLNKKQSIAEVNMQLISCVELIDAPKHECNCFPVDICKVKKSKYPFPKPIASLYGDRLFVTAIDGSKKFDKTTWWKSKDVMSGNKYGFANYYYYLHADHLYTLNFNGKVIKTLGLFGDLIEVHNFEQKCNENVENCVNNYDIEFNMDDELVEDVVALMIQNTIDPFIKLGKHDARANERDDIAEETK